MKTKPVPIVIVLCASGVSCIVSILQRVTFGTFFIRLLCTVVIFAILGCVVKIILDRVFNKKDKDDDKDKDKEDKDSGEEGTKDTGESENPDDEENPASEASNEDTGGEEDEGNGE